MSEATKNPDISGKIRPGDFISFALAVVFFSGICYSDAWYGIFDFTVLDGEFGRLVASATTNADGDHVTAMANYRGKGGSGAIDGFMFALSLVPSILFSVAMVTVFEHFGALRAAAWCLTPILRPGMGLPGTTTLAIIASLQSTDAGAALTRSLKDSGQLTEREANIFATFQMTAGAAVGNFLSSGVVVFTLTAADGSHAVPTTIGACLGVILLGKVFAANLMRFMLIRQDRKAA